MNYTARGLAFRWTPPFWGALRDTANAAHLALVYARHAPADAPALRCWAASQLRHAPLHLIIYLLRLLCARAHAARARNTPSFYVGMCAYVDVYQRGKSRMPMGTPRRGANLGCM